MDGSWIVSIVFSFLIWLTLLLLNIQSSMLLNPAEIFLICQKHPGSKVSIKLSVYGTAIPPITVTTAKIANKSGFFMVNYGSTVNILFITVKSVHKLRFCGKKWRLNP